MNKVIKGLGVLSLLVAPFMALASGGTQGGSQVGGNTIFNILGIIAAIINVVIPILITLAVLYLIWGVIKYAMAKESEEQAEGRRMMINGIIVLFVIVSIWGLVAILNSTFNIDQGGSNLQSTDCAEGTIIGVDQLGNPIFCQP